MIFTPGGVKLGRSLRGGRVPEQLNAEKTGGKDDHRRSERKLLGWTRDRLGPIAGLSVTLLMKIEDGLRTPTNEQRLGIQDALEAAGIVFTNGDEPGVKLKAPKPRKGK